jgi:hypothetical protein
MVAGMLVWRKLWREESGRWLGVVVDDVVGEVSISCKRMVNGLVGLQYCTIPTILHSEGG